MSEWRAQLQHQLAVAVQAPPRPLLGKVHCRAAFISDFHMGTSFCRADALADFLNVMRPQYIYIVGDAFDGWALDREWYWDHDQQQVVELLLAHQRAGAKVVYVPGNHDEAAREFLGQTHAGIPIVDEIVHITADGQRLLVLHGDQFDNVVTHTKWLAKLGDVAYAMAMMMNKLVRPICMLCGAPDFSLSAFLKYQVKEIVKSISGYPRKVQAAAAQHNATGIVCGHVHHASQKKMGKIMYYNDGDWVESCTALVEWPGGRMEILHWLKDRTRIIQQAAA